MGHLLIDDSLISLPALGHRKISSNRLSIWEHIQKIEQHFWIRWHCEYLNELTTRTKWASGQHPIKEGTLVLIREDNVAASKSHPGPPRIRWSDSDSNDQNSEGCTRQEREATRTSAIHAAEPSTAEN